MIEKENILQANLSPKIKLFEKMFKAVATQK